ncbi:hypothetical protein GOBAR_DD24534 [Gossypium barbadense]|nr:hypothetical protein GOBAR_DD24534 [Gossypium barbadense]
MGPFVSNIKDKDFSFLLVNFQTKLDKNKHGAVRVVESGEYDASKGKENNVFKFGEASTGCSNPNVQTYEDSNVQQNKLPDCELGGSTNPMVELSVAIEDIVRGIEWGLDANLRTDPTTNSVMKLWEYLDSLAKTIGEPLVLAGDFNSILEPSERASGQQA